ncbi:MAG: phosphoribosylformylglycinamidine synthase subunit PurQ, partial [Archaeoglobaceae archaeon]
MKREKIRVCVLRVGGTNCDAETKTAFEDLGVRAEVVHANEVIKRKSLL